MTQEEIEKQSEEMFNKHILEETCYVSNPDEKIYSDGFNDGAKWGMEHAIGWHDLRKNPNDLPKEDCETVTLHDNGNKNIIKWKHREWTNAIVIPVIAWCELPQFKDKE